MFARGGPVEEPMAFRILQVVREFSLRGGVESVAFELQRAWDEAGVPATVLTSQVGDDGRATRVRLTARWLRHIQTRGHLRYLGRLIAVPWFTIAATWALRRDGRDAVVLSHGDTLSGDVLVIHAVNRASLAAKARAGNYRWLLNPMHFWVLARDRFMIGGLRYRRYVGISRRIVEELVEHYAVPRERISFIPNGINLARFAPGTDGRAALRSSFGIPADAPVLLFVGHEFDRKGLRFVIEALPRLGPTPWLLVVGSDNPDRYRRRAEALGVAGRVVFAGTRRDLPELYRAADVFVFPTEYEASPLVSLEALASGVPVFATSVGGIEDYLVDGVNGFRITRDADSIVARLSPVLENPALLASLRQGAFDSARAFSWSAVAAAYRDMLSAVWAEKVSAGRSAEGAVPPATGSASAARQAPR
jgi:UDP-glucose:(heptosyl)LPS alpha-1,3-glucosyltransferase